ncbi:hypothetical protein ACFXKI_10055 [Streptomyces mirabilis]|uniref:hypothetical protein n=1 Tax=Streptomyces mirabilis TaxID=68239 RepID=UPI0036AE88BA
MTTVAQAGATAPAAGRAPRWPTDWDRVLDTAIRTWGGEWDTKRVQSLFQARYSRGLFRSHAREFLARRAHQGVLQLHERPDHRVYTRIALPGGDA